MTSITYHREVLAKFCRIVGHAAGWQLFLQYLMLGDAGRLAAEILLDQEIEKDKKAKEAT